MEKSNKKLQWHRWSFALWNYIWELMSLFQWNSINWLIIKVIIRLSNTFAWNFSHFFSRKRSPQSRKTEKIEINLYWDELRCSNKRKKIVLHQSLFILSECKFHNCTYTCPPMTNPIFFFTPNLIKNKTTHTNKLLGFFLLNVMALIWIEMEYVCIQFQSHYSLLFNRSKQFKSQNW